MRNLIISFFLLILIVPSASKAVIIGDEKIAYSQKWGTSPFRILGQKVIGGGGWYEEGYAISSFGVLNQGTDNAHLFAAANFAGCGNGDPCTMTETDGLDDLAAAHIMGFQIKKMDLSNFSLEYASLLPNGFDPHVEGTGVGDTKLFIGEFYDPTKSLFETMDIYDLGALWEPRLYREINFGDRYSDVNELYVFTSTDAFWGGFSVNNSYTTNEDIKNLDDKKTGQVNEPNILWLFMAAGCVLLTNQLKRTPR